MPQLADLMDRLGRRLGPVSGSAQALDGGITNRNFRVRFGERDYVVRLPGQDTALLGIDRAAERLANQAAASLGIAPQVAAADADCLVTVFLGGVPADAVRAAEALGRALRTFHDSATELPVTFWVPDLLDRYASIVAERGVKLPPDYAEAQSLTRRIADALPLDDPVPCHNDLLPGNLLTVEDRVVLVDWEYAGMGHRLFDLGNLAVNNEFGSEAERRLLSAYFEAPPTAALTARLRLMRLMSDAREAAWGVVQGVISDLEFDFAGYARKHFERLRAASANVDEWVSDAATA
jgi:aminoglycoside phosphotransferase (APT) family kinase protein